MKTFLFLICSIPLLLVSVASQARIKSTTATCDSGMIGVECRKIVTVTDYRDNNDREWPKASVSF